MSVFAERLSDEVLMATVVLRVADLDRAVEWYRDKLGMSLLHRGADGNTPPYAVYDLDDNRWEVSQPTTSLALAELRSRAT